MNCSLNIPIELKMILVKPTFAVLKIFKWTLAGLIQNFILLNDLIEVSTIYLKYSIIYVFSATPESIKSPLNKHKKTVFNNFIISDIQFHIFRT